MTYYRYLNLSNREFEVRRPFFHVENDPLVNGVTSEVGLPVLNAPPQISWEGEANFSLKRNKVDEGNIDISSKNFKMWFDHSGDYEFTSRGSLGQIIRKYFVLVPGLKVNLKPEVMWPDKKSVDVDVSIQNGHVFSGEQNKSPFIAYENTFSFNITRYSQALKIEIPHLEWKLNLSEIEDETQDWHMTPDEVEFDVLEQVDYPRLAIRINGPAQDLEIHLLGKHGKIEPPQSNRISISKKGIWNFDLRQVRDQVLNSGRSETFDVQVTKKGKQLYQGRILSVRPQWDLQKLDANWKKADGVSITVKNRNERIDGRW